MATYQCYMGILPFKEKAGWETYQKVHTAINKVTYSIEYSWNVTGGFYTARIVRVQDDAIVGIFRLVPGMITTFIKDPDTKEILFAITPISIEYGKAKILAVWITQE